MSKVPIFATGAVCLAFHLLAGSVAAVAGERPAASLDRGDFGPFVISLNNRPYGYSLVRLGNAQGVASIVERFEVRPGDCFFNRGYNDCLNDRERAELSERGARSQVGSQAWYGWSFFLPPDWPDIWPAKTVLGQFHQKGSHPVWMFLNCRGALCLDDHSRGRSRLLTELIPATELKGKWHKIEVHARWERDEKGVFEVWVDGRKKFGHCGPTMTASVVYFKYGVYRAFVSRYAKEHEGKPPPAQTALFANVRKAASREGLALPHKGRGAVRSGVEGVRHP